MLAGVGPEGAGLGKPITLPGHLQDAKGLEVTGKGGLGGVYALFPEFFLQLFLTVYGLLADNLNERLMPGLDVLHNLV